ncbi:MAG: hypothetical protein KDA77_24040, partial [Planctomycetaceae bacterium]|nr:hypothetical protein [Planctomycetaceae bacterium]
MEQKRLLIFVTLSATVLFIWQLFVVPIFAPPQKPAQQQAAKDELKHDAPLVAIKPGESKNAEIKPAEQPQVKQVELLKNPRKKIVLGSLDPDSGYFLQVSISTQGAAVSDAFLNDPLYRDLKNQQQPLKVLDEFDGAKAMIRSLETEIPQLDQ